jgi:hypothetical protein
MVKAITIAVAIILLPILSRNNTAVAGNCDEGYALCMSGCINEQTAERCMQSCQAAEARCRNSGVFKMPAGFVLRGGVLEHIVAEEAQARALPSPPQRAVSPRSRLRRPWHLWRKT